MTERIRELTKQISSLQQELNSEKETEDLLRQLYHHHQSHSKPQATACSPEHHAELAMRIQRVLWKTIK